MVNKTQTREREREKLWENGQEARIYVDCNYTVNVRWDYPVVFLTYVRIVVTNMWKTVFHFRLLQLALSSGIILHLSGTHRLNLNLTHFYLRFMLKNIHFSFSTEEKLYWYPVSNCKYIESVCSRAPVLPLAIHLYYSLRHTKNVIT